MTGLRHHGAKELPYTHPAFTLHFTLWPPLPEDRVCVCTMNVWHVLFLYRKCLFGEKMQDMYARIIETLFFVCVRVKLRVCVCVSSPSTEHEVSGKPGVVDAML